MAGLSAARGSDLCLMTSGRNRQVHIYHPSATQAISLQSVPATDHLGWHAKIVRYPAHSVAFSHLVCGSPTRIRAAVLAKRVLTRCNRDDQLPVRFQAGLFQLVGLGDGLRGRAVVAR